MKKNKLAIFLEYAWLVLAIVSLGAGVHKSIVFSLQESILLYVIAVISLAMYIFKKQMRKKRERDSSD